MSAISAARAGQRRAEALMVDTVTGRRLTGSAVDPETGVITPTYTVVYTGKAKFQVMTSGGQHGGGQQDVGQASVVVAQPQLHLPMSTVGIQADDEFTCDTSLDPDLVGRKVTIVGPVGKTFASARRFDVIEVSG